MSKTIWFINDYAGSATHGMEFRNYYFAREFVKQGYDVYIITASYTHLFKELPKTEGNFTFENIEGIHYVWVKVPHYSNSTDKKRILKWFIFTGKLFFLPSSKMKKPDVVVASPMSPFLVLPTYRLAQKHKAKFIYEVKDIWPMSIIELGNISAKNPLIRMMSWCEEFAVRKADSIVSSLQNYGDHLKNDLHIDKKFTWINNGISLDEMKQIEPLDEKVRDSIPKNKFIVGYTGTIGIANALDSFLESAKHLQEHKDIVFVIVGEGKEKNKLLEDYQLNNILFLPAIAKSQVQSMLSLFDACYIGWNKEKIYEYGISANKIFDYMYSAKPILHSYSGKSDIVKLANCGITMEAKDSKSIADAVLELYGLSKEEREILGQNAKAYVLEHFTYEKLAKKYKELF